ncbi:hypothetical protein NDU88_005873 [Pleurodeles waltl]|uniref:Uncharacterized protein n=1 Tax=Pleurodeles waltl TaxID=8319 RepID=A0AAV7UNC2_PLEWA|nr:hypothetical protein NDU88_005873 [Pleurodeles waltl]
MVSEVTVTSHRTAVVEALESVCLLSSVFTYHSVKIAGYNPVPGTHRVRFRLFGLDAEEKTRLENYCNDVSVADRMRQAFERHGIPDEGQYCSAQDSALLTRTWDASCQVPDGSLQMTPWSTTVKKAIGLIYFIFVGLHQHITVEHIRLCICCRISK